METHFGKKARSRAFSERERQVMIGSLLGDASLIATTAGFCFRVHHSVSQRPLADWKYSELTHFVRTPPRRSGAGYYFRTVTHPALSALRADFYRGFTKIVPYRLIEDELSPLALAIWIMDDGARDGRQLRLNTQGFTLAENLGLVSLLNRKFGLRMTINYDKNRPRLRCSAASMGTLIEIVSRHVLPEMFYKLGGAKRVTA